MKIFVNLCLAMALSVVAFPALAQSNDGLVRQYLEANRAKYNLASEDVQYNVTDEYYTKSNGITHVYLHQVYQGIPIFQAVSSLAIKDGKVASFASRFLNKVSTRANATTPMLTPEDAVMAAAAHLNLAPNGLARINELGNGEHKVVFGPAGIAQQNITVELLYQQVAHEGLRLAWNVNIYVAKADDWWNVRIDAVTGEYLDKNNWTITCNAGGVAHKHHADCVHHEVLKSNTPTFNRNNDTPDANMTGTYNILPIPLESPSHGSRALVSNPDDAASSPFGWHDTNGAAGAEFTDTRGNNVFAQEDADANNTGGARPSGGGGLNFNFPANFGVDAPAVYQDAAITNLFYMNNIVHDVLYHYGFDEAGGNFQENNYGNGGLGSDPVNADGQDGSGTNNANFSTPPDGSNPRMQMYIWTAANPDRDSDFDNGVIAHEYGHGVSNRLTGGPANTSCLGNQEQMGEGWSDYMALMFSIEAGDVNTDIRGIGTYVLNEPVNGTGIRTYPYTTNMGVNPFTYDDIKTESVPHGVGSVWCTMLWDMTWDLIAMHGFSADYYNGAAGNNIALNLVMEGMKLQPCSPGFVDGRDAILQADVLLYGGAHQCLIWQAFADRGLGYSAVQGSSNSRADGTQAFDLPPICLIPTAAPTANFSAVPNPSCGAPVVFTDLSTDVPQAWAWDYGDGNTANVQFPPAHTYASPGTYTVTLTASNNLGSDTHTEQVTVYPAVSVTVTNGPMFCGQSVITTATSGGASPFIYAWSNGDSSPNANAMTQGEYTLTVTDANGCTATVSAQVNAGVIATVTADIPPPYCGGPFPVLTALGAGGQSFGGYQVATIPNNFLACGANNGPAGDDATNGPHNIGFTFNYYGQPFTTFGLSSNGNLQLGGAPYNNEYQNVAMPTATFGPAIALGWTDLLADAGDITYHTLGVSPNRVAVICFNNLSHFGGSGGDIVQGQVQFYETTNVFELHLTSTAFTSATQGFQLDGVTGTTIRNGAFTSTDARRVTPISAYQYLWSNGSTNNTLVTLATGTYTVTITDDIGCSGTASYVVDACCSVSIAGGPNFCGSGTLTANATGGAPITYAWSTGETTPSVAVNASGTFSVTTTDAAGCTSSATVNAVVNPGNGVSVAIDQVPGNPICTGSALLTGSSPGCTDVFNYDVATAANSFVGCGPNAGPTGDDNISGSLPIGFSFNFYGVNYTDFGICTNGFIQLGTGPYNSNFSNGAMPSGNLTNPTIALVWDDFLADAGDITYGTFGVSPNRTLVVCFNNMAHFGGSGGDITSGQIILHEGSNNIEMHLDGGPFIDGTQGVQENAGNGITVFQIIWAGNDARILTPLVPCAFQWSTGETTAAVNATLSGTYTLTVTDQAGCTGSAAITVAVGTPPTVSISQDPSGPTCGGSVNLIANTTDCGGGAGFVYYLESNVAGAPWGQTSNVDAMNAVFNAGNWIQEYYETANVGTVFNTSTAVVFMEGSDGNANELNAFFTANQSAIENWVSNGGRLFLNAAPNEGGNQNWGFGGVTLDYNGGAGWFSGSVFAAVPGHPIFNGPWTPVTSAYTGGSFAHAIFAGSYGTSLLTGDAGGSVLAEKAWGLGDVIFGGITTTNWQSPFVEAQNFRNNILYHLFFAGGLGCTYQWSTGSNLPSISVNTSGTYSVTTTNIYGCTASATITVDNVGPPVVNITQNAPNPICNGIVDLTANVNGGNVSGNAAYLSSQVEPQPWGLPSITNALDAVYGIGGWADVRFENVNPAYLFDVNNFGAIHMEGGDIGTDELLNFLATNQTLIENWVSAGGNLLINFASNEVFTTSNLGFGGVLSDRDIQNNGILYAAGHPMFNGPNVPAGAFSPFGFNLSHNYITNGGNSLFTDILDRPILTEMNWGAGRVYFGGLTLSWFEQGNWGPQPELFNAYKNLYVHMSGAALSNTYAWSNGATSQTIIVTQSGTYDVTVTNGAGCTGTATYTIEVGTTPTVSISQVPNGPQCGGNATLAAISPDCGGGAAYYLVSNLVGQPWGINDNINAMDAVYGSGNWTQEFFETANVGTVFSPSTGFVFLEGSDYNTDECMAFFAANQAAIEAWVSAGGRLFFNVAPNESLNQNLGFGGVTLLFDATTYASTIVTQAVAHSIYNGPFTPVAATYNAFYAGHGILVGPYGTDLMDGNIGGVVLSEKVWGGGKVIFGSLTLPFFFTPNAEAQNLRQNTIDYLGGGGACTYAWSTGETSQVINVSTSGVYEVTLTNAAGCTAVASQTVVIYTPPTVTIDQNPANPICGGIVDLSANSPNCGGGNGGTGAYYVLSTTYGEPWGMTGNQDAMNAVYGAGNWTQEYFETANIGTMFSPATGFVFLEGSDGNADELNAFFTANQTAIEAWVAGGGRLFLNAAPNEGGSQNWGFGGVTLNYPNASGTALSIVPGHPIFNGPFTPITAGYTGTSYAHATLSGPYGASLLDGDAGGPVLTELAWGSGKVMFGGMTQTGWHSPFAEAQNLRNNIVYYLNTGGAPCTYAWSNGSTNQTINVIISGTYDVTVTDANGCTASATTTVVVSTPPTVSIDQAPNGPACSGSSVLTTNTTGCNGGNAYYVVSNSQGEPWGMTGNMDAMNSVYGAGNWTQEYYETANAGTMFSAATGFVFLEGSDLSASELDAFFTANQTAIEAWVAGGGHLFLNAAVNEGGNQNWGFGGVSFNYNYPATASNNVTMTGANHPVFFGPYTPVTTAYTGNNFAHAILTGPFGTDLLFGDAGGSVLSQLNWGSGIVMFGTMTQTGWHGPFAEAQNLRTNIVSYLGGNCSCTYLWSNGETSASITVGMDGAYDVTVTNCTGCTATATINANVSEVPTVTIAQDPPVANCGEPVTLAAISPNCSANAYYITETTQPWGQPENQMAMDAVFGAGNWVGTDFATAGGMIGTIFSNSVGFVFIDGSDFGSNEFDVFLDAFLPNIEAWVAAGGNLFLNNAPNEGTDQSFGFGGTNLNYGAGGGMFSPSATTSMPGHPIFNGPFTPVSTAYTGGYFGHAIIDGNPGVSLLDGDAPGIVLSEKAWGAGVVMFGTMTTTNFHSPQPDAMNLRQNILSYLGGATCTYAWSTGETSQSITTATNGTYVVTLTDPLGCTATASIDVIFNPDVTPPTIVCPGTIVLATTPSGLIAHYPLQNGLADATGNNADIILIGNNVLPTVPSGGSPLCINGRYQGNDPDGQDATIPQLNNFNPNSFEVQLDFTLSGIGGPYNTGFPIFMGGVYYRWLGIYTDVNGVVGISYNNSNLLWSGMTLNANQTYHARLAYSNNTAELFIDGVSVLVSNIGPLETGCDFTFTTSDWSIGYTLFGCIQNVMISNLDGNCGSVACYSMPSASDDCGTPTVVQIAGLPSGSFFPIGTTTNTFVATDGAGNTSSCSFDVIVIGQALSLICPGNIAVTTPPIGMRASYPLQNDLYDYTGVNGDIVLTGNTTVPATPTGGSPLCLNGRYIYGDPNNDGQDASTPFMPSFNPTAFEVELDFSTSGVNSPYNTYFPVIMCGDSYRFLGIYMDNAGVVGIKYNNFNYAWSAMTLNPGQTYHARLSYMGNVAELFIDNVLVLSLNVGPLEHGNNFVFTTSDFSNGLAFFGCLQNLTVTNLAGDCTANVFFDAPVGSGGCGSLTTVQTTGLPSYSNFPVGTTTNTFVVTDGSGNTASCSFDVVVTAPTLTLACQGNVAANTIPAGLRASYPLQNGLADATGNYGDIVLSGNNGLPAVPAGGSPLCLNGHYVGGDPDGQDASTPYIIDFNPFNFEVELDFSLTSIGGPFNTPFPVLMGGNLYRWLGIYVDAAGVVGIKYNNYYFSWSGMTLNAGQTYHAVLRYSANTAELFIDGNSVLVSNIGPLDHANYFNFTTSDFSNGLANHGCIQNLTVTNLEGICGAVVSFQLPEGNGGCGTLTTVQTSGLQSGSVFPIGTTTNTFVVTDGAGNTAECSFDVVVTDNEAPVVTCPATQTLSGQLSVTLPDYSGMGTATDNCGGATITQTFPAPGTVYNASQTVSVTLTATDAAGNMSTCIFDVIISINGCNFTTAIDPPNVVVCPGATGMLAAINGVSWMWSNGETTQFINAVAGTYTVTVTDGAGCTAIATGSITEYAAATLAFNATNTTCGQSNGALEVVATGTSPYTYLWSNGGNTAIITGLAAGPYSVTVTDANGCVVVGTAVVGADADVTAPSITCPGTQTLSDPTSVTLPDYSPMATATDDCGTVTVAQTFPAPGTVYNTSQTVSVTLTATDGAGNMSTCIFDVVITIGGGCNLTFNGIGDGTCPGFNNGIATIDIFGGTAPYSYDFGFGAQTSNMLTGLAAGTYPCTVTDASGCIIVASAVVPQFDAPVATATATNATCPNAADGMVDLTVTGGAGGYSYLWSNGEVTEDLTGVMPGTYTVTVTDGNGCTGSASATVGASDVTPPSIACPGTQTLNGQFNVILPDFSGMATASDNCGTVTVAQASPAPGTTYNTNQTVTVVLVATDGAGNTSSCSFQAIVIIAVQGPCGPNNRIYVDDNPVGVGNDGTSWDNAFLRLESALAAATVGSEIWVKEGTYKPTPGVDRAITFNLKPGISLYGGFPQAADCGYTLFDRDADVYLSICSGDIGVIGDNSDNSYRVMRAANVGASVLVDGFVIRDGNATSTGGGLAITTSLGLTSSPTIVNCDFVSNYATTRGAGVYMYANASGTINTTFTDCNFNQNTSGGDGGGVSTMSAGNGTLTNNFVNCGFANNDGGLKGGGISSWANVNGDNTLSFSGCTFTGNIASTNGGGIWQYCRNGSPYVYTVDDCTFTGNSATNGAGMYNHTYTSNMTGTVSNSTFTSNVSGNYGTIVTYSEKSTTQNHINIDECSFVNNTGLKGGGFAQVALTASASTSNVTQSEFRGNSASGAGSYHYSSAVGTVSNAVLENNVYYGNSSPGSGAGVATNVIGSSNSTVTISFCTFNNNVAATNGGAVQNFIGSLGTSTINASNSIFYGNTVTAVNGRTFGTTGATATTNVTNSIAPSATCAANHYGTGVFTCSGLVASNPLFIGGGDLHLMAGSPAIDVANAGPAEDYEGDSRPAGAGWDWGAYEFGGVILPRENGMASDKLGMTLFPNPTTDAFTVQFSRTLSGTVEIIDLQGRVLSTQLVENVAQLGLRLGDQAAGTYFVRVISASDILVRKVVLNQH